MKLTAKWSPELDPVHSDPSSIVWEDGTFATLNDYRKHELDTHCQHMDDDGAIVRHMYPDIIAEISYQANVQDWVMRGHDVTTTALELHDPDATDAQIMAGVFTFPTVYRYRVIRG